MRLLYIWGKSDMACRLFTEEEAVQALCRMRYRLNPPETKAEGGMPSRYAFSAVHALSFSFRKALGAREHYVESKFH